MTFSHIKIHVFQTHIDGVLPDQPFVTVVKETVDRRIMIMITLIYKFARHTMSACRLNLRCYQSLGG